MDGWMDGWMEQREREMDGWNREREMDGWIDRWIWRLMDEWMDE